jgi:ATP-binding cassette, subfamily B, bacterial
VSATSAAKAGDAVRPRDSLKPWRVIWRLVCANPWLFALDLALQLPRQTVFLVTGLVVKGYFEQVAGDAAGGAATIWALVALLLGTYAARVAVVLGAVATHETYVQRGNALLRRNAFAHLLDRPGALPPAHPPGETVSRLIGDVQAVSGFQGRLLRTAGDAVMALSAVAVLARVDARATVVVALPVLLVAAAGNVVGVRIRRYQRTSRAAAGRISAFLADMFGSVQAVQVAAAEERVGRRFRALNAARRRAALKGQLFGEVLGVATDGIAAAGTGAVLVLVAGQMRSGAFTVGELALFAYYLPPMAVFTSSIGRLLAGYQQAAVSVDRLAGLLDGDPPDPATALLRRDLDSPVRRPRAANTPLGAHPTPLERLEVTGLTYRHPHSGRGIAGVNLMLPRGSFVVITGRTGSGKTTLLRTLLGLLPKDAGEIRWNGEVITDPAAFFVPPRAAYAPQAPHLFRETLRDNILLGLPDEPVGLHNAIRAAARRTRRDL